MVPVTGYAPGEEPVAAVVKADPTELEQQLKASIAMVERKPAASADQPKWAQALATQTRQLHSFEVGDLNHSGLAVAAFDENLIGIQLS
jgi:hypothetical protein